MVYDLISLKMESYENRLKEIVMKCSEHIIEIKDFIKQHYENSVEEHKSDPNRINEISSNCAYCLSFANSISYFIKSMSIMFEFIRLNLEKYINSEQENYSKIDPIYVFNYMDDLLNVIWIFDESLMDIKREKQYKDFRKDKNFQTICETINGELSNFVDVEKLNKIFEDFFKETKYASSYMGFVYTNKMSYRIEGKYINVFDAIIKHTENLYFDLHREIFSLVNSINVKYNIKDCKFDDFAFFVTNVIMNDIVFSVLPTLEFVFKRARYIMPE